MESLINSFENNSIHCDETEYEELLDLSEITKSYLDNNYNDGISNLTEKIKYKLEFYIKHLKCYPSLIDNTNKYIYYYNNNNYTKCLETFRDIYYYIIETIRYEKLQTVGQS